MHLGTTASSSEDFRSVIDDLTVQNKKLKRKLKKYEKLHDSHLQAEKLFEIRVHGLPSHKKRELEETLRKFAIGLDGPAKTHSSGTSSALVTSVPAGMEQKTSTPSMNLDSAYASASGQNSSGLSGSGSNSALRGSLSKPGMTSAQQRDIQTYLSDIPQGLLPKPVAMTEKSKKKLIVRRLEQIFAGKGASKGGHQHPLQQQEISQIAARADRSEREASGRLTSKEGAREARIMRGERRNSDAGANAPVATNDTQQEIPRLIKNASTMSLTKPNGNKSPDQRPTRPLDLDPNRAQVPEDNIRYLRHLGFSPLEVDSDESLVDGHGYMYLNVLINMAQLHTLNVTPEFVKKSVEQYSNKLELSSDARKVRWKGGNDLTRTSSNGSPDDNSNTSGQPSTRIEGRKKSLLASASGDGSSESYSRSGMAKDPENKLAYVPLFYHQPNDEDDDDSDDMSEWSSPEQEMATGNSSGLTSSGVRTSSSKKRQNNDGPIIFYNRVPFVTDLSGDWRGANVKKVNLQDYSSFPIHAVGIPQTPAQLRRTESKGPISKQNAVFESLPDDSMDVDSEVTSESMHGLSKPPSMKTARSSSDESPNPIEFEASGIGGVHPSDNFAINIKSRHTLARPSERSSRPNTYPPQIRAILAQHNTSSASSKTGSQSRHGDAEILSNNRKDLPPSELPPPSYFPMSSPDDDSSSDEDDSSDISDDALLYSDRPLASMPLQALNWQDTGDDDEGDEDEDMDSDELSDDSDGSVDMLAHARQLDPETVRVAEREYDSALADRLADEIVAGSSAATAGGGSGFNSPATASEKVKDAVAGLVQPWRASTGKGPEDKTQQRRGILKRTRTSTDGQQQGQARPSKSPKLDADSPPA